MSDICYRTGFPPLPPSTPSSCMQQVDVDGITETGECAALRSFYNSNSLICELQKQHRMAHFSATLLKACHCILYVTTP